MDENIQPLQISALFKDAQAQWKMACAYFELGKGRKEDLALAFSWICQAAENGCEDAAKYVLSAYDEGKEEIGVQPDPDKLVEWADKLSAAGSNTGRYYYAHLWRENIARDRIKPLEAFSRVAKGADEEDALCMAEAYLLGQMLAVLFYHALLVDNAVSILKDVIRWLEKLDQTEITITDRSKAAMWYLYGRCLHIKNQEEEALQWFKKAMPWNANAEIRYAVWLGAKAEQTKNASLYQEAASYLLHAVNSNEKKEKILEATAYAVLAVFAREGNGMSRDINTSYQWTCRAAELGNEEAKQDLPRYHKKLFGGYSYK